MDNLNGYAILILGSLTLLFVFISVVLCLSRKEDMSDLWGGILLLVVIGGGSVALGWHILTEEDPRPENYYFQKVQ